MAKTNPKQMKLLLPLIAAIAAVIIIVLIIAMPRSSGPKCGDGICDENENSSACPYDCGVKPSCGDGVCIGNETCTSCKADCGECGTSFAEQLNSWLPGQPCDFIPQGNATPDGAAFKYAIDNQMLEACECILDEGLKATCRSSAKDVLTFNQAVQRLNPRSCELISDPGAQEACKSVIASAVEQINATDPLFVARLYTLDNNGELAIPQLESIVAQNASNFYAWVYLSLSYSDEGLFSNTADVYMPKAIYAADKALNLSPDDENALYAKAFAYEAGGELYNAIETYSALIAKHPDYIKGYMGRGHAYNKMSSVTAAIRDFEKAEALDPERREIFIYSQLCRLYSGYSSYAEKAIDACNIVINISSYLTKSDELMGAHIILTELYMTAGRFDEAKAHADTAIILMPKSSDARITLSRWYALTNDYTNAEATAQKALELDPKRAAAYSVLAFSQYQLGDMDGAIDAGLKGLELIDSDISLLPPNRPSVKRDLCYITANAYSAKGDAQNFRKYADMGNAA